MGKTIRKFSRKTVMYLLCLEIILGQGLVPATSFADTGIGLNRSLSSLTAGTIINFGGTQWILLNPSSGYVVTKNMYTVYSYMTNNVSDSYFYPAVISGGGNSYYSPVCYWLNNDFYNNFTYTDKDLIKSTTYYNTGGTSINIGLLTYGDWNSYKSILGNPSSAFWTCTSGQYPINQPSYFWYVVMTDGSLSLSSGNPQSNKSVRPAAFLKSGLYIDINNNVTSSQVGVTASSTGITPVLNTFTVIQNIPFHKIVGGIELNGIGTTVSNGNTLTVAQATATSGDGYTTISNDPGYNNGNGFSGTGVKVVTVGTQKFYFNVIAPPTSSPATVSFSN